MKFAVKTSKEFSANFRLKAYAKLQDGSYIYSDALTYSIYDVADVLYKNRRMTNANAHNYLYDSILSVVNKQYARIDY